MDYNARYNKLQYPRCTPKYVRQLHEYVRFWIYQYVQSHWLLWFFMLCNILIYFDRGMVASSISAIEKEFQLYSWQTGTLGTAFMFGYMFTSPFFGYAVRYVPSTRIMAAGLLVFAGVSVLGSFSSGFITFMICRTLIGTAEASYAGLAPSYVKSLAPEGRRTLWMGFFFLTVPLGAAMGYIGGGIFSTHLSWKVSFVIQGILSLPFAVSATVIPTLDEWLYKKRGNDPPYDEETIQQATIPPSRHKADEDDDTLEKHEPPPSQQVDNNTALASAVAAISSSSNLIRTPPSITVQGASSVPGDASSDSSSSSHRHYDHHQLSSSATLKYVGHEAMPKGFLSSVRMLFANKPYVYVVAANSLLNFVTGAVAFWIPTYIVEELGLRSDQANLAVGIMTLVTGIGGGISSSLLVDGLTNYISLESIMSPATPLDVKRPVIILRTLLFFIAVAFPLMLVSGSTSSVSVFFVAFFFAEFCFLSCISPINTLLLDLLDPREQELGMSVDMFCIHLFGDFPSPFIFGAIREYWNMRISMYLLLLWILMSLCIFSLAERRVRSRKKLGIYV